MQATAKTKVLPQKLAGTLKEGITHRRVFFSPPGQPNETSVVSKPRAVGSAARGGSGGYQPTILSWPHRANTPSAGQDSRCPTFYTISVRYVAPVVKGNAENLNEEKVLMDAKHVRFFSHWARLRSSVDVLGPSVD